MQRQDGRVRSRLLCLSMLVCSCVCGGRRLATAVAVQRCDERDRDPFRTTAPSSRPGRSSSGQGKRGSYVPSMGSVGACYDDAMDGGVWSQVQVELLDTRRWKSRVDLANAIFEYIEIFHNRRRRHSSLGMRTPIELELLNTTRAVA
jgi:hypothetical protein